MVPWSAYGFQGAIRVLTGRRYRLVLTPEQAEFAGIIGSVCRSAWNTALEQRPDHRRRGAGGIACVRSLSWLKPRKSMCGSSRPLSRAAAGAAGSGPGVRGARHVPGAVALGAWLVGLEDLNIRSMTRSARGIVEVPGTNVKQKAGLNRSILDKGWYAFELALHHAAHYTGSQIIEVPAPYTSQRCSACRRVDPDSRESRARFRCTTWGPSENADVNAAQNVLADGQSVTACRDLQPWGGSVKQEPAGTREALPRRSDQQIGLPRLQPQGRTSR